MSKTDLGGLGLLGLLLIPGVAIILLIVIGIFVAVFLGIFAVIYITLQAYHVLTACIFLIATLGMVYVAMRSGIITEKTMEKYPWIWVLIPVSFGLGYVLEAARATTFTVAPLAVMSEAQQGTNFVVLLILVIAALYILIDLADRLKVSLI